MNILEGITRNYFFLGINIIVIGLQILIIFVGSTPFNISSLKPPQTGPQWATAIILGALSIPIGMAIRLIPDELIRKCIPEIFKRKSRRPGVMISDEERFSDYPDVFTNVRDELAFLKKLKGGRLNNLKFAVQHPRETFMSRTRSPSRSRSNSVHAPRTPIREDSFGAPSPAPTTDSRRRSRSMRSRSNSALGAPTVMAGIIAGSVAAGWSPIEKAADRDFSQVPRPSPSPLSHREGSTSELSPVLTEEPMEMDESDARGDVPQLRVPQPPSQKPKSLS
jgi:P-type Ca2+ transporter type 2C